MFRKSINGRTKIQKDSLKVTANISDLIYSAITIGVKLINSRKSHCVFLMGTNSFGSVVYMFIYCVHIIGNSPLSDKICDFITW